MKTKFYISVTLLITLIVLLPLNSFAQREPKNRIPDDRLKTRLPINDQTKPRERLGEKEKIKEKIPPPPIKEKKPPDQHFHPPIVPDVISHPIEVIDRPHQNPKELKFKKEAIARYEEGDYSGALAYFNLTIAHRPDDFELYFYRGMVELELEFYDDAKKDLTTYFENIIDKPEPYYIKDY